MSNPIHRLQVGNANLTTVATTVFSLVNELQSIDASPGEKMAACLALSLLAMRASGYRASELAPMVDNIINDAEGIRSEFRATLAFIKNEIFNKE